jgi:predicted phosphohydrolase
MRIQYCSDLHLEFDHNSKYLEKNPIPVSGDTLLLAGDIVPLHDENFRHPFFSFIADNYKNVFWIPGNHEFYHKDMNEFSKSFHIKLRSNIHILHNTELEFENIRFIFSTLWTKISPENERIIEQGVSDFSCIEKKDRKLRAPDYNKLHTSSLDFVKQSLQRKTEKTVVVTHHLPSDLCNSKSHKNSPINEAFYVDLTNLIEHCDANFWIYGHSHFNQKPLFIGNTLLLTNQLGYVHLNEHTSFKPKAYFSI